MASKIKSLNPQDDGKKVRRQKYNLKQDFPQFTAKRRLKNCKIGNKKAKIFKEYQERRLGIQK